MGQIDVISKDDTRQNQLLDALNIKNKQVLKAKDTMDKWEIASPSLKDPFDAVRAAFSDKP